VPDTEWLERRRHRIGASDVAAALTGSWGQSPASVIAGKLDQLDDTPTERMLLGLALEDRVVDSAAALLGATVVVRQAEVACPVYPWLVATCDALVIVEHADTTLYPLEVKTTSNPDGYPADYLESQLHVQMVCCEVGRGFSAVRNLATGTLDVREHRADPWITAAVLTMGQALWDHLQTGVVPSPTFPADSELWNRLHPTSMPGTVELPGFLVDELREARADLKAAENRAGLVEAKVKELLGDFELGAVDGTPAVRWQTVTSRRVDLKTLEAAAPDLVGEHRKESTARRFTVLSPVHQPRKAIPS
jgi:predicted phage-related endonuclease